MRLARLLVLGFVVIGCGSSAKAPAPKPPVAAVVEPNGPFLWRVEAAAGPTYLFGTVHTGGAEIIPPLALDSFAASNVFVMEADVDKVDQNALLKRALIADGTNLEQKLTAEEWIKLVDLAGNTLPAPMLKQFKPWLVTVLAMKAMVGDSEAPDLVLRNRARERKIPLDYLEDVEAQFSALETVMDLAALKKFLADVEEQRAVLVQIVSSYTAGDASTLEKVLMTTSYDPRMHEALFVKRNRAWIAPLEKHIATGNVFVAVGAGHLLGPDGVVTLLRAKGHKVTRVSPAATVAPTIPTAGAATDAR